MDRERERDREGKSVRVGNSFDDSQRRYQARNATKLN